MNIIREKKVLYQLDEVFDAALKAFRDNFAATPIHVDVLGTDQKYGPDMIVDKLIKLTIGEKQVQYYAEIKNILTRAKVGLIVQRRNLLPGPILLVANYVNDVMAKYLKENKVEFIDATGNAYINQAQIYIDIRGNRPKDKYRTTPPGRAFVPTGLKVVFTFLCDPLIVNKNYRTIAHAAGVALGNIGWIVMDLKRQGFLLDMGRQGFKLIQKQRLLDRFVEEYPIRLRRQLILGKFRGDRDWWGKKDLGFENALWGGEVAAAKMGNYLKPQIATVYLKRDVLNEFVLKNRLKKDDNGEVEVLRLFWDPAYVAGYDGMVNPILTYADLIATANQRNIEAAKVIYENDIVRFVRED
ncbi:MAG: hypothetical protein MUQ25_05835 [Candidatus Aminicenantes bacterium]|nr:hypothetical protein [Candidatus Aminicenantes bacterium]